MITQQEFSQLTSQWDVVLPPYEVSAVAFSRNQAETFNWGHTFLKTNQVYSKTKGKGVAIAILDTAGTFAGHPDLRSNSLETFAKDFTDSSSPTDKHGHGTHCAGIAAATQNGFGLIGAAPEAKLIPIKVLNDKGAGSYSWIAKGIKYIADLNIPNIRTKVISLSLGGGSGSSSLQAAVKYAIAKGCFVVAAAGNSFQGENINTMNFPARYNEVIAVGSIDKNSNPSRFSSAGPQLDIVVPGEQIYSTHKNQGYAFLSGTSMATPLVAGVVALLASHRTELRNQAIMHKHLRESSKDIFKAGFDNRTGFGIPFVPRVFGLPIDDGNPGTTPPPPPPPPTTVRPPRTTPEPGDPRPQPPRNTSRKLQFAIDGPFTVVWQTENSNSLSVDPQEQPTTADEGLAVTFKAHEIDPGSLATATSQNRLTIQRIEFDFTTKMNAEQAYDTIKQHFQAFFTNRGLVLETNNDFIDAIFFTRHFLQVTMERRNRLPIKVTFIQGKDARGREAYLVQ
ncbi:MAG: S8 family peptidase [Bacteroidota bacterium]